MILVTGATGLVGSHLLFDLLQAGVAVRSLRRKASSVEKVKKTFSCYTDDPLPFLDKIEWVDGDLLDNYSLDVALEGVSKVYHCAGMVSFNKRDRHQLMLVNQQGTANLVNACLHKGDVRFCHVSSVSALGRSKQGETITEDSFWKTSRANSIYALSKYSAEREVWRAAEEGLNMVIVNPSVIIGPGDWQSGSTRLFSSVYKGVPLFTEGITGYVDVRDVVKIMTMLTNCDVRDERFIISAEDIAYRRMLGMIAIALGKKPPRIRLRKWMAEIAWRIDTFSAVFGKEQTITKEMARSAFNRFYFDSSKVKQRLNFRYIPIEESILHTARIFLKEVSTKNPIS